MGRARLALRARSPWLAGLLVVTKNYLRGLVLARYSLPGTNDMDALKSELLREYAARALVRLGSEELQQKSVNLSIVVPVFNNVDLFESLAHDIALALKESKLVDRHECIVVDDESDAEQSRIIAALCNQYGFGYRRNESNLGYLRSVNLGCQVATFQNVLVLNTDVRFRPTALDDALRVQRKANASLVTVPSFSYLVDLGLKATSWIEADALLKATPAYMSACTAAGYFLLWRRETTNEIPFDESLGHGYGEDTDLHYRTITTGGVSVLALNACVAHVGAASYSLNSELTELRRAAWSRFEYQWGDLHQRHWPAFELNARARMQWLNAQPSTKGRKHALAVVVPGISSVIGGLSVVQNACARVADDGEDVVLVSLDEESGGQVVGGSLRSVTAAEFLEAGKNASVFCLAGHHLPAFVRDRCRDSGSRLVFVLQGPDWYMAPKQIGELKEIGQVSSRTLVNSSFMMRQASFLGLNNESLRQFGIQSESSGRMSVTAETSARGDIAAIFRGEHGKASWAHAAILNHAALRGERALAIVPDEYLKSWAVEHFLLDDVKVEVASNTSQVMRLLRNTNVFLDLSLYEGYGMVAREALEAGCRYVGLRNGGNEELSGHSRVTLVNSVHDTVAIVEAVDEAVAARRRESDLPGRESIEGVSGRDSSDLPQLSALLRECLWDFC